MVSETRYHQRERKSYYRGRAYGLEDLDLLDQYALSGRHGHQYGYPRNSRFRLDDPYLQMRTGLSGGMPGDVDRGLSNPMWGGNGSGLRSMNQGYAGSNSRFYDPVGLGALGVGLDGLSPHSGRRDLNSWGPTRGAAVISDGRRGLNGLGSKVPDMRFNEHFAEHSGNGFAERFAAMDLNNHRCYQANSHPLSGIYSPDHGSADHYHAITGGGHLNEKCSQTSKVIVGCNLNEPLMGHRSLHHRASPANCHSSAAYYYPLGPHAYLQNGFGMNVLHGWD